jgi:hypothetical protein
MQTNACYDSCVIDHYNKEKYVRFILISIERPTAEYIHIYFYYLIYKHQKISYTHLQW